MIEDYFREHADGPSFNSIVASGIVHLEVGWGVANDEPHLLIADLEAAHEAYESRAA